MDLRLEIKEAIRTLDAKEDICNSIIADNCIDYEDMEGHTSCFKANSKHFW